MRPSFSEIALWPLPGSPRDPSVSSDRQRPEPPQAVGTATGLVDAADLPLAAVDGIIRSVLVDPRAKAGRTEFEGHPLLLPRLEGDDDLFPRLQVFQPDHTVRISGLQNLRALQSEVLPVAIGTRNAVYG
jgi:hypothetical protein